MATGGGQSSLSKFECTICLEDFKRPKLLPCHHTFCAVCLDKYVDRTQVRGKFECPLCRKTIKVPKKGVEEFQTNFYIEQSEKRQDQPLCDACSDKSIADHRCLDCRENFCSRCTTSHMNMKISRHHRLLELSVADQDTKRKIKHRVFCTKHDNKEIEVICKQCDKLLCLMCMTNHQGHESREITEEAKEVRNALRVAVKQSNVQKLTRKQKEANEKLSAQKTRLHQILETELEEVDRQGSRLHDVVDRAIKTRKDEVKTEYTKLVMDVDSAMEISDTYCNSLVSIVTTAENVIEQTTDIDILEKGKLLCAQLNNERKLEANIERSLQFNEYGTILIKGAIDEKAIDRMVGSVACLIGTTLQEVSTLMVTKAQGYTITGIAPIRQNVAWVAYNRNTIEMVDTSGRTCLEVDVGTRCNSVTSDRDGNCIIGCPDDDSIQRVTVTGKVEKVISGCVGALDSKVGYSDGPCGIAYRITVKGSEEVLYSCDSETSNLSEVFVASYTTEHDKAIRFAYGFAKPCGLAVDEVSGKVCVCQTDDCYDFGNVTILDDKGNICAKYNPTGFLPSDASFDGQGFILVSAKDDSQPLHRINQDGHLVEILTKVKGSSVAVDRLNRIWVGGDNGRITIYGIPKISHVAFHRPLPVPTRSVLPPKPVPHFLAKGE